MTNVTELDERASTPTKGLSPLVLSLSSRSQPEGNVIRGIGLGFSLFFVAAGAILAWAVTAMPSGIDLEVTGAIVFGIGCLGVAVWLVDWIASIVRLSKLPPGSAVEAAGQPPPPR